MNMRLLMALSVMLFGLFAFAGSASAIGLCGSRTSGTCIDDGDTFFVNSIKYNLTGIDAPELDCGPMWVVANNAARRLAALLSSNEVFLTQIRNNGLAGGTRDTKYIAQAIVNGQNIGQLLIAEGLARPYRLDQTKWC